MGADYDVIIVGGGFAGVTAAREVRKAGLQCVPAKPGSRTSAIMRGLKNADGGSRKFITR